MNSRTILLCLALLTASTLNLEAAQKSPNIVIILADDFGYGSSNCYGADARHVQTPHINRLAREGMQFLDANTPASVCSPTRYAMLTGRYAWRGRLKYGVLSPPEGPLVIEPELLTLPEYLKQHGYQTAHIGKWHLGYTNLEKVDDLSAQPLEPGPRSLGFDYTFAVPNNHGWLPNIYVENEAIWGLRSKGKHPYGLHKKGGLPYHGYDAPQRVHDQVTQDLSDHACKWITEVVEEKPGQPFFLYYAPIAVHHPITPSKKTMGTSGVGPYGDFIHDLDNAVGDILDALDAAGVLEDTLVLFASDNGGDFCPEEQQARELGFKNNGDVRGDKHQIWQGGFKVPLIVRWPKVVQPGARSDRMVNVVDIYATLQDIVGGQVQDPKTAAEDSFSFYPILRGDDAGDNDRATMVMNDAVGVVAIRMGDWKYIEGKAEKPAIKDRQLKFPQLAKPQLYNLKDDPAETADVIDQFPEVAERMQQALDKIRSEESERLATKHTKR